jgi:hypothetical protein
MKAIVKVLLLILTVAFLYHCKKDVDPRVNITDNNFLKALIEVGVDKNRDGIISPYEAEMI